MSNVHLAKDIYAAFGRSDIPTVLARFHPEIEWRQAEGNPYQLTGRAWVGPQAVLEKLFMRLGSEWEGFTVTVHPPDCDRPASREPIRPTDQYRDRVRQSR